MTLSFALAAFKGRQKGPDAVLVGLAVMVCFYVTGCGGEAAEVVPGSTHGPVDANPESTVVSPVRDGEAASRFSTAHACPHLVDVASDVGIDFVYSNGATGNALMVESTGGGAGWLDYDNDGRQDLYFVQGGQPEPDPGDVQPTNRFFRHTAELGFVDVTDAASLNDVGYGQGVAVGDFDNDGFDDVFVTNIKSNRLLHNLGDGTFEDVTEVAGVEGQYWSTSTAWADLDLDGDLDLFVCNYLDYDPSNPVPCLRKDGSPGLCAPNDLQASPNECFMNGGDGRFEPVAEQWGLVGSRGKSLGVAIADFDNDNRPDVFVANDTEANFLYINRGPGRFVESGVALGCAMNGAGLYQASMGVAVGDYNRDGLADLYVTHFTDDSNTLYTNLGPSGFVDSTAISGMRKPTMSSLGFGTVMADLDLDGHDELFVTNGHIDDLREQGELYQMPPQLFGCSGRRWHECSEQAGPFFQKHSVGRAVATADYDNDGDLDLAVVHQNGPAALLQSQGTNNHYLQVQLCGVHTNRRGVGATVALTQGETRLVQQLVGGSSYCASHQPILVFGLGSGESDCSISIRWPGRGVQRLEGVRPDQTLFVQEPTEDLPPE